MGEPNLEDYRTRIRSNLKTKGARDIWDDVWDGFGWFMSETKTVQVADGPNVSMNIGDKKATVEIELAGYSKKDVKVTISDQIITVTGARGKTRFSKTFKVDPDRHDIDSVQVVLKNGLLTITIMDRLEKVIPKFRAVPIQ